MRLTMARNLVGVFRPGSRGGGARRHRQIHASSGPTATLVAELQFADAAGRLRQPPQLVSEPEAGALVLQQPDRGFNQHCAETVARDQRPARLSARQQRFPASPRRSPADPSGPSRSAPPRAAAAPAADTASLDRDGLADLLARAGPYQGHQREIIAQAGVGDAAALYRTPRAAAVRLRGRVASAARSQDRRMETAHAAGRPTPPPCRSTSHSRPRDDCPTAKGDCRCRW